MPESDGPGVRSGQVYCGSAAYHARTECRQAHACEATGPAGSLLHWHRWISTGLRVRLVILRPGLFVTRPDQEIPGPPPRIGSGIAGDSSPPGPGRFPEWQLEIARPGEPLPERGGTGMPPATTATYLSIPLLGGRNFRVRVESAVTRPTSQLPTEADPPRFAVSPTDHGPRWLREVTGSPQAFHRNTGRMSMFMRLSSCVGRSLVAFGIKGSTLLMPHPGQAPTEVAPTLASGFGMAAT